MIFEAFNRLRIVYNFISLPIIYSSFDAYPRVDATRVREGEKSPKTREGKKAKARGRRRRHLQ